MQQIAKGSLTPCLSYLRVSGKGQLHQDGFTRQRESIARFAKIHDLELLQEYREEGISGTTDTIDRPALTSLFERLEGNGVKLVLVEHADRLARDLIVQELIVREFQRLGVRVVAAESGTDLAQGNEDPTKKLVRQILGAIAEFEKCRLVRKLRVARDRKRGQTGRCEGPKPFGELPGEKETLQRIRTLFRKPRGSRKRSLREIVKILNAEGQRTRFGKPWSRSAVWSIAKRGTRCVT